MNFENIVAVIEKSLELELKIVQDSTAFEVASGDGKNKVQILLQNASDFKLVLISANLGEVPPEGREALFRSMLEANNLFSGTAGATLSLDATSGEARLQRYVAENDLANDVMGNLETFIETALTWSRLIADYRPSAAASTQPPGEWNEHEDESFRMMQV